MRHGRAESYAASDSQRRITEQGHLENRQTAAQLLARSPVFDQVLCSPYLRAKESFSDLKQLFPALNCEMSDDLTPDSSVHALLSRLERLQESGAKSLLLVGHNPLLSDLICLLVEGQVPGRYHLDTSVLACINVQFLAPGCGEIEYLLTP